MVESVDGVGELLEDLKKSTFEKYDAFTVGEVFNMKPDELPEFIGETGHFSTIFDFSAHTLTDGEHGWYDAPKLEFAKWRAAIIQAQLETQKYGFKANIIENHDEPRGASRFFAILCSDTGRNQDAWYHKPSPQRNSFHLPGAGNRYEKCQMEQHGGI